MPHCQVGIDKVIGPPINPRHQAPVRPHSDVNGVTGAVRRHPDDTLREAKPIPSSVKASSKHMPNAGKLVVGRKTSTLTPFKGIKNALAVGDDGHRERRQH